MADTLLIHYSPDSPELAVWSIVNADGELSTKLTRGNLAQAASSAANHKVIMLLDSNFVHLDSVRLPTRNKQKLLNAVPFALEDDLADEIEDLHFVIANTSDKDTTAVACINKETLDTILGTCNQAGIKLDAILPDALCLTADTEQWAILLFNESALIQQDILSAASVEKNYYKSVLNHALQNNGVATPDKIILFQIQDEACEQIDNEKLSETEIIQVAYNDHPIVVFCGHYKQAMPLNLLQNDYKPVRKNSANLKRWRLAASVALIWMTMHLGDVAFKSHKLENSNNEMRAQIIQLYKESFPRSKKIVNARVQMEQKLNELRSGGDGSETGFVSLLSESHTAFSSNKDITINALNYRNNSMDITVTSTNLKSVERINKELNAKTLKSEIISSASENNIVKGNLRIQKPQS